MLQNTSELCEQCLQVSPSPLRFIATLHFEQITFKHEVSMYLMWIKGVPIVHIADFHTDSENVIVLRGKTSKQLWYSSIEC